MAMIVAMIVAMIAVMEGAQIPTIEKEGALLHVLEVHLPKRTEKPAFMCGTSLGEPNGGT